MQINLINDMIDLEKYEQMKFQLYDQFFDLTKTKYIAFENMAYLAKDK